MTTSNNRLDQEKDIAGSYNHNSSLDVSQEALRLGEPISGQSGSVASITGASPNMIVSGLSGITDLSIGRFITLFNASSIGNNGTFLIIDIINASSVIIYNALGISPDINNGSISWIERRPYSLEDDINYQRSDRANIKGVDYFEPMPQYTRCTDQINAVDASLLNLAGKTTDAKSFVDNLKFQNLSVVPGDTFITLSSSGDLKHADSVNLTGVPIYDGYDVGNNEATFVAILDNDGYATELTVYQDQIGGSLAGWRIFGRTRAGSAVSPNSVEIEFRAVAFGSDISSSTPYTWESVQPSYIDVIIGYRTCLNNLDEAAFRKLLLFGVIYGGQSSGGGGTGSNLPLPTEYGQILFAQNTTEFIAAVPVVNDEGLIMIDNNGKIVAVGV